MHQMKENLQDRLFDDTQLLLSRKTIIIIFLMR